MGFASKVKGVAAEAARLTMERRRIIKREVDTSGDFIATSRKTFMHCSCGMTDECWSLTGFIQVMAKAEWRRRHSRCEGSGVEFHER